MHEFADSHPAVGHQGGLGVTGPVLRPLRVSSEARTSQVGKVFGRVINVQILLGAEESIVREVPDPLSTVAHRRVWCKNR